MDAGDFGSIRKLARRINTRAVLAHIDALRAEFKKDLAEFELRLNTRLSALERRIERLEEQRGLVRP